MGEGAILVPETRSISRSTEVSGPKELSEAEVPYLRVSPRQNSWCSGATQSFPSRKKLEEDPVFVRNYLIHTYQDHEGHHLSLSILGCFYGFGSGVAAVLFFDVSAPVLGSAIALSNLWLWSRVRYHSRAMEQIRNKIIVVERTLENDGYGFTSFLGHKPNETNYTHYTKITKVGDKV